MVIRGGKLLFRLALAAALASICLSAYVITHAQTGPSWEVPVAVMQELRILPVLSMGLAIVSALLYFGSSRLGDVAGSPQRGFLIVLLIAFACPFVVWLFKPEQWPFQFEMLSFIASVLIAPVAIASIFFFWLIGFRWRGVFHG
jgi:hypothetical protein